MGQCLCGKSNYWPPLVILTLLRKTQRLVINPGQHKLEMFLATGNKWSHRPPKNWFKYFQEIRCSYVKCACVKPNYCPPLAIPSRHSFTFPSFPSLLCSGHVLHWSQKGVRGEWWLFVSNRRRPGEDKLLQHARFKTGHISKAENIQPAGKQWTMGSR